MASSLSESRVDHRGEPLPDGVYALVEPTGEVISYKARWRERDNNGVQRQRSKSFSRRDAGSLDNDLRWHLHDLWPEQTFPGLRAVVEEVERHDRPAPGAGRADRAREDRPRRVAPPARAVPHNRALEAQIAELVAQAAPQLLAEPGFGPLTAGKLIGEIASAQRFATDAKLARAGGIAPIPVSSGNTNRHRLDRGGNRQINTAIHRVAITRARCHPETKPYLARKRAEGKTSTEAIRCLKRHLSRRIWHLLQPPPPALPTSIS